MTPERSAAYGRLMDLLQWCGLDLLPEEEDQIRHAADALLFCDALETDREARMALSVASHLVLRRVVSRCALGLLADRVIVELLSCGPEEIDVLRAA